MKYILKRAAQNPCFHVKNNIIVEVNNDLLNLTGYSKEDLTGKSLTEISNLLKITSQVDLENIESECSCYIFTREYEAREIDILCNNLEFENEKIYFIKEKPNSRIDNRLPYVESISLYDEVGVAIYSFTNGILLKVNNKFLNFWGIPYKERGNIIGKTPEEIFSGAKGSDFENIFLNVIKTGKPYFSKGVKYESIERGDIYWDVSLVPILISGKEKFLVHTAFDITEKVLFRKTIEEKKEELEVIIENMSDGLYMVDKDYNYNLINSSARDFFYKSDNVKKLGDTFTHTKDYDSEGNLLTIENLPASRVLKGEILKEFRLITHRSDGIYHFSISGSPIYDKNGNIERAILCIRDVTEQKNKDDLIRRQKEELDAIIENMSDGLGIIDKKGVPIKINKSAREIFLFNTKALEKTEYEFKQVEFYGADGDLISEGNSPVKRVLNGEKLSNYRIDIKVNNDIFHTEISGTPIYDKDGALVAGVILTRDITDRIKKEENLLIKAQLDLLNNIMENIDIGFVRCSYPGFNIIDVNNKSYNYLKHINPNIGSLSSIIGQNFLNISAMNEDINIKKGIQSLIGKRCRSYFCYRKFVIEGEEKFFKKMFQPLIGVNNQIIEIIVITIDITEEVKAKNKMEEILKIQEGILANVSHELKTPLNVIFSTNQLMEMYLKNNSLEANKEKINKYTHIIKQNCYRFIKLINNLVDLSRIESGFIKLDLSNENIVQVIEDIVQSISEYIKEKDLSIVFDTNTEEKIIACDPEKIERIILNLISNAIKFSDPKGMIFVNLIDKGDTVEITVRDTGIGIDKKHIDYIFKRFHQVDKSLSRNAEGSGIGLTLVKSIIEVLGGKISVESEFGKGSIFKVELPARTLEESMNVDKKTPVHSKVEMINIEFSDIYSI